MACDPRGLSRVRTVDETAASLTRDAGNSGVWDYREWQWWQGHPWGDSCRPRYWTTAEFLHEPRDLAIRFHIDGFACEQKFLLPTSVERNSPHWDVVVSVENVSGADVEEYHGWRYSQHVLILPETDLIMRRAIAADAYYNTVKKCNR